MKEATRVKKEIGDERVRRRGLRKKPEDQRYARLTPQGRLIYQFETGSQSSVLLQLGLLPSALPLFLLLSLPPPVPVGPSAWPRVAGFGSSNRYGHGPEGGNQQGHRGHRDGRGHGFKKCDEEENVVPGVGIGERVVLATSVAPPQVVAAAVDPVPVFAPVVAPVVPTPLETRFGHDA